ncbi:MAG: B12-binding domain-containing radical SAM protein [Spirochaetes bacterium]|jgi:radical SAM superfamily enzyme YgiQ (UPF0313 family)|nr:B12-binding domain-containing radical SAM protein [Spirochaetota bacterium]
MKKKILMVYPEIPTTYWSFRHAMPFAGKKALMPPLGLITVAAMIPAHYEIRLVDMNISRLDERDVLWSDIVFISAMIVQKDSFARVVETCNRLGRPVAAGGPYPTTSHDEIRGVDHFILNEGEVTLPKFIADYQAGRPAGIYTDETKPDITKTPVPRFDLLEIDAYGSMALQSSRGCPYNCEFCDIIEMFGRTPRYKKPEQLTAEMEALKGAGYTGPLFIVDDNFIGNRKKVKEILARIIVWQEENGRPFSLYTEASINLAQDGVLMDMMVEAGFNMVFIGIETPDTETLEMTNKQHNVRTDIMESVGKIQRKGIEVLAGFILGFDNEPENIFDLQLEFIRKSGIPLAMIGLMMALPNTQLHRRLQREGRLRGGTHGNNTHEFELNFIPTMPVEKLVAGYKRVISEIYRPSRYFDRCFTLIKRLPKKKLAGRPVTRGDIKALFMSLAKQSFTRYGHRYLAFIIKTLLFNPWNMAAAFNLSIKGYHFFKITGDIIRANEFKEYIDRSCRLLETGIESLVRDGAAAGESSLAGTGSRIKENIAATYGRLDREVQALVAGKMDEFYARCDATKSGPSQGVIE